MSTTRANDSTWAGGVSVFAASMMLVVGAFQFFEGLVAVANDTFYVKTPNYVLQLDTTQWGWIHMILGAIVVLAGVFIFTGNIVARSVGILIAGLSALANFFWLPYYPLWSITIIAIDVFVIWALCSVRLNNEV
jgi:hypothetical protein